MNEIKNITREKENERGKVISIISITPK